ncbi:MAG TPA: hypothetical protein VHI93_02145, partial [Candidatus Thermoplasmatota archaeon]|nr:hypothetical protein [Candidatus Thermoplasmatota archaeon]
MPVPRRLLGVTAGAALALCGLALGAQLQSEGFLPPDLATQAAVNQAGAAGNPIFLTGAVAAAGVALAAAALAAPLSMRRLPRLRAWGERAGLLVAVAVAAYVLANFVQAAFPTVALLETQGQRSGTFVNNLLAADRAAVPSALLPVFGALLGGVLVLLWALKRLAAPPDDAPWDDPPAPDPVLLLHRQLALLLLSTPAMALAAWGALRLVAATPAGRGGDPYRILLPLVALVLLGLLAAGATKAWQAVRYLRQPRAAPLCEEAWTGAGRAEAALAGALALLCLSASLFKPLAQPLLQTGQTFGSDLPRHVQSLLLALLPLAGALRLQREGQRLFAGPPLHAPAPPLPHVAAPFALAGLSFAAAGAATLLAGWAAWCMGNTLAATYDPRDAALLQFDGSPGVLALWRVLGAALAGLAAARLAHAAGSAQGAKVVWPLAAGTGLCVVAVALLELPLAIWTESSPHGQLVKVGSTVAAQEPAV